MGCVCHTHTSVRLYCLQRLVPHYVLQSNQELEMTVVAGLVTPDGCWIGGDSLSSTEDGLASLTATPKVGRFGNLLLGYAGSFKIGQMYFKLAGKAHNPTLEQLLESVKLPDDLKDDWELLAIENGRLYEISSNSGAIEARRDSEGYCYGAIGSGAAPALGSLYTDHEDEGSLYQALEAAAMHTTNVRSPFLVIPG